MKRTSPSILIALFYLFASFVLPSLSSADEVVLAPGYGDLGYQLSAPGSYELHKLGKAPDALVLDEEGKPRQLHDLLKGKYNLLSFIYSNCKDVNGCPLSSYVFYKMKAEMQKQPELAERLRLISFSFDPVRDTPEVMRLYGKNYQYAGKAGEWRFLTTESEAALEPILQAYNQEIQREISVNGEETDDYAHILRVFLIDPELEIRNIYSVGFLHPDILQTDLKTLFLETLPSEKLLTLASADETAIPVATLSKPGDNKDGYDSKNYQTQTKALMTRTGEDADLFNIVKRPPLGLPPLPEETVAGLSPEKIELGRKLFFDRRLSLNDTFSCAMCHVPEQGFTSNEMKTSVGVEGRSVRRNAPTLYNVAYPKRLFHDGREFRLEEQIWAPLLAHNEMANPSIGYVLEKIRKIPDYQGRFEQVYDQGVSMQNLGDAFSAYQRALLSANSAFDRWKYAGQEDALSENAKKGFRLFTGKAGCVACHHVGEEHALFSDDKLHNTGIGYKNSMGIRPAKRKVALAPGVFVEVEQSLIDTFSEPPPKDVGLYEVTQNPADRWKYKTPGLRNVALTAPYMHDGAFSTLREVVDFYNQGGIPNPGLSPLLRPLQLNEDEVGHLVTFMESLTGSNVDELVSDAFAAPVGDLTRNDPNWANQQTAPIEGEAVAGDQQ
ncbi:MAG: cytochrome c peroxidase [Thiolinea sp.]